jgi:dolichol-phosphate mannosyltransferase
MSVLLLSTRVAVPRSSARRPKLSLVIPTLNEAPSLPHLLPKLEGALRGISHEVLIVDDSSTDGTADLAEEMAETFPAIRVIRREGAPSLSGAVLDGFAHARGSALGVMDADLQHDVQSLPRLLAALRDHDIAIGSRYAFRGKTLGWSALRKLQSRLASGLTRSLLDIPARDPLSGFFVLRRSVFEATRGDLAARGWKILLELLTRAPWARVAEVPYTFGPRRHGQTKMSGRVIAAWLAQLRALWLVHRSPQIRPVPRMREVHP